MTTPILFLDVDGVIAIYPRIAQPAYRPAPYNPRGYAGVRPRAAAPLHQPARVLRSDLIARLNHLCRRAAAKVVISSSWRLEGDARGRLRNAGVTVNFHDDWHTDSDGPTRADEITRWSKAHEVSAYVVLDDYGDNGLDQIWENWVQPDFRCGLSEQDAQDAFEILHPASSAR